MFISSPFLKRSPWRFFFFTISSGFRRWSIDHNSFQRPFCLLSAIVYYAVYKLRLTVPLTVPAFTLSVKILDCIKCILNLVHFRHSAKCHSYQQVVSAPIVFLQANYIALFSTVSMPSIIYWFQSTKWSSSHNKEAFMEKFLFLSKRF